MKEKRKARKELIKKVDISVPINIEILGGENDPCFGKLFKPDAPECLRCGDSEICSIVLGQMSHVQRKAIEAKGQFKDIEEDNIPDLDKKMIRKKIKSRVREIIRMAGKKGISEERLVADIHATYVTQGFSKTRIQKIARNLSKKTDKFTYSPKTTHYTWK